MGGSPRPFDLIHNPRYRVVVINWISGHFQIQKPVNQSSNLIVVVKKELNLISDVI
jgi:hypothetical protein